MSNERTRQRLAAILDEIDEFLEDQEDVMDGSYGEPRPNRAMSLLAELREARSAAPAESALISVIEKLPRIVPSDLGPDKQWRLNSEYVNLYQVKEALKSAAPREAEAGAVQETSKAPAVAAPNIVQVLPLAPQPPTVTTSTDEKGRTMTYWGGLQSAGAAATGLLPASIRRRIERECEDAEHPKGMSTHDGRTRIHASDVRRLLAIIDRLSAQSSEAITAERDKYFAYWNSVRESLPVGVAEKWRGHYAHFYCGYWYVKRSAAERELARSANTGAIPEGWKIVPITPTDVQKAVGKEAWNSGEPYIVRARLCYEAMIDAAPTLPDTNK